MRAQRRSAPFGWGSRYLVTPEKDFTQRNDTYTKALATATIGSIALSAVLLPFLHPMFRGKLTGILLVALFYAVAHWLVLSMKPLRGTVRATFLYGLNLTATTTAIYLGARKRIRWSSSLPSGS